MSPSDLEASVDLEASAGGAEPLLLAEGEHPRRLHGVDVSGIPSSQTPSTGTTCGHPFGSVVASRKSAASATRVRTSAQPSAVKGVPRGLDSGSAAGCGSAVLVIRPSYARR